VSGRSHIWIDSRVDAVTGPAAAARRANAGTLPASRTLAGFGAAAAG
jgi:hypothetical protein